jgi:HTH domain
MAADLTPPVPAADGPAHAVRRWPLLLIAAPAAVAVWSGWVGLGGLCGFGIVHPLPGIIGGFRLDTAITLPVGVEAYGAYALGAWLTPGTAPAARTFARRSALGALGLGMAGQVIYHLLAAARAHAAPWPVVMLVSCLPVLTLGFGAALTHLLRTGHAADPAADTAADMTPDTGPDTAPALTRTPRRTRAADTTAARVARLRDRHPNMTVADIAARLKISDRTVRRHLAARPAAVSTPPAVAA